MIIAYIEECSWGSTNILLSLQNYAKNAGENFFRKNCDHYGYVVCQKSSRTGITNNL